MCSGQQPQFTSAISNPGSSASTTSRTCNVVCSNGNNPCNLSPSPAPAPAPGPAPGPGPAPAPTSAPAPTPAPTPSPASPPVSCESLKTCHACSSSLSCGWCSKSGGVCQSGSENGSSDGQCLRSSSSWVWGAHACGTAKSGDCRSARCVVFLAPLEFGGCSVWHYLDYRRDVFCLCVSCVPQLPVKLPCSIRYMSLSLFCCCWHYLEIKVKGATFSRAGDAELCASSPNNRAQYGDAPIASQEAHRHVYRVKPTIPTAHPLQGLVANVTVTVKIGAGRTKYEENRSRNLRMHTRLRNKPTAKNCKQNRNDPLG